MLTGAGPECAAMRRQGARAEALLDEAVVLVAEGALVAALQRLGDAKALLGEWEDTRRGPTARATAEVRMPWE